MRLIDADELLEQLETLLKKRDEEARHYGYIGPTVTWNDALYVITNAPTIDTSKNLLCTINVNMDTDEIMERLKERGWGPVEHGWWRYFGDETIEDGGYCSVCLREQPMFWVKKTWRYVETRYCPHCGAKMDEVSDHDDHL